MNKGLRIFYVCLKRSLIREMSFRSNFFIRTMTDAVFLIIYFIFFSVLFSKIPSIVGWERDEFILLVGTFHMVNSLFLSIFYPNLVMLPEHIKGGTLDHFLLKPMEAQLLISIHTIDIGSLFNILLGLSLVISSALNLSLSFTLGQILGFFFNNFIRHFNII